MKNVVKKKISIKFTGFWPGFSEKDNFFTRILTPYYDFEFSDTPDYIFCSVLGEPYEECRYDGIRIHWNGENYTPDFNIHDYGISFNDLSFGDRHLEYPLYLVNEWLEAANEKHLGISPQILSEKEYFCNFIYGVSRDYREEAFEKFSTYKKVMSTGTGRNNMPNHPLTETQAQKIAFQQKTKFTIAFDSTAHPGFVTEKILHAFAAKTVPVYFGAPDIGKYFNKKSFIDVADYGYDLDKVLQKIIEIDQDDERYLSMLKEPAFNDQNYLADKQEELENFLLNIFEQDYDKAFRRSRIAGPQYHNDRLKEYNTLQKNRMFGYFKKIYKT